MFGVHRPGGSRYAKKARFAHRPRKAGANMTVEEREMIRREREAMKDEL